MELCICAYSWSNHRWNSRGPTHTGCRDKLGDPESRIADGNGVNAARQKAFNFLQIGNQASRNDTQIGVDVPKPGCDTRSCNSWEYLDCIRQELTHRPESSIDCG